MIAGIVATIAGGLFAGAAAYITVAASPGWLLGPLLLGAVIPFTLIVVLPTNTRRLRDGLGARAEEAVRLRKETT